MSERIVRIVCIVQARMGSTRLPGKSMALIAGRPMIEHVLERAGKIKGVDEVVLATPDSNQGPLIDVAAQMGIRSFGGSENDVLARYYHVAQICRADVVVRVTGDCPLLDPHEGSEMLWWWGRWAADAVWIDYLTNRTDQTDGLDIEIMTFDALGRAQREAKRPYDREHVTSYIHQNPDLFRCRTIVGVSGIIPNGEKWSVDTEADLELVRARYPGLVSDQL